MQRWASNSVKHCGARGRREAFVSQDVDSGTLGLLPWKLLSMNSLNDGWKGVGKGSPWMAATRRRSDVAWVGACQAVPSAAPPSILTSQGWEEGRGCE